MAEEGEELGEEARVPVEEVRGGWGGGAEGGERGGGLFANYNSPRNLRRGPREDLEKNRNYNQLPKGPIRKARRFPSLLHSSRRATVVAAAADEETSCRERRGRPTHVEAARSGGRRPRSTACRTLKEHRRRRLETPQGSGSAAVDEKADGRSQESITRAVLRNTFPNEKRTRSGTDLEDPPSPSQRTPAAISFRSRAPKQESHNPAVDPGARVGVVEEGPKKGAPPRPRRLHHASAAGREHPSTQVGQRRCHHLRRKHRRTKHRHGGKRISLIRRRRRGSRRHAATSAVAGAENETKEPRPRCRRGHTGL